MTKKEVLVYLSLSILIFFYANCLIPDNYPNINTHKSFNPDSLLKCSNSVEIIIEPEFDTYLLKQDIWIKVDVINNSDSNFYSMQSLSIGSLIFNIFDPDNIKLKLNMDIHLALGDTAFILKPCERIQEIISLKLYFGQSGSKLGTYRISCGFYGDGYHESSVIESNMIEIEVMEPKGYDKKLYYLTGGMRKYPTTVESILYLKNLINQYNKSVYTPQLYETLIFTAMNPKCDEIFESSCDEYFNSYLDFFETKDVLEIYFHNLIYFEKLSNKEMDKIFHNLRNRNKTEKSKIIFDSFLKRYMYKTKRDFEDGNILHIY